MGRLFHTMGISSHALYAARQGLDTTGHNIANSQTEGYSRQRVKLVATLPTAQGGMMIGNGVEVAGVERYHDVFGKAIK